MTTTAPEAPHSPAARPWWRYPMVWFIIAGPALVVVAGFYTYYLAARSPDPVLTAPVAGPSAQGFSHAPAAQARNHAATGELPTAPKAPER